MPDIPAYLAANRQRFEEEMKELLRIPSVSTDPERSGDVNACAEHIASSLRSMGITEVEVVPTAGNPIIVAHYVVDPAAPTLLVYGHYDVQPVDPVELWDSPPFEPTEREGRLYARGAVDDKGQVHIHMKAIETRLATGAGIPVNLKLVIEGEEEIGSPNLEAFLRDNADRLACDAVVISDTGMLAEGKPTIAVGLRGLAYMEIFVDGPATDLHSGSYGGGVANPANVLADIIAALKDENDHIVIPGFYDAVRPITDADRADMEALPFTDEEFLEETGARAVAGEVGYTTLERLGYRPTLDVNGMLSGFTGEGAKTVLPARAMAKVSMRLVPDQDPDTISRLFAEHVESIAPDSVTVTVRSHHGGQPWAADPASPVFEAAAAALQAAFDAEPVFMREGGSIPIVPLFQETFDAPVVLLGFSLPGANLHAPNEWIDLDTYHKGIATIAGFYDEVAARGV